MKAEDIVLTLGEAFSIKPEEHGLGCLRRQLIWRDKRPVGHWSFGSYNDKGYLWLQNYAGYYSSDFFLEFENIESAIARAKKILQEWDDNPERPTWVC